MATKEELHQLVDWLPEDTWEKVHKSLLRELKKADPVAHSLYTAPVDDEEETEEERLSMEEVRREIQEGKECWISHEDVVKRHLELP